MSYTLSPATPNGNPINTILLEFSHEHGDADFTTFSEMYLSCTNEELQTLEVYIRFLTDYMDSMDRESSTSYLYKNGVNEFELDENLMVPVLVKKNYSVLETTINNMFFSFQFEHDQVYQDEYCCSSIARVVYYDDCGNELLFELD